MNLSAPLTVFWPHFNVIMPPHWKLTLFGWGGTFSVFVFPCPGIVFVSLIQSVAEFFLELVVRQLGGLFDDKVTVNIAGMQLVCCERTVYVNLGYSFCPQLVD